MWRDASLSRRLLTAAGAFIAVACCAAIRCRSILKPTKKLPFVIQFTSLRHTLAISLG
jgi:hypothetical protein